MATKDVLIDVTRPQDYQTESGKEILFLGRRRSNVYPLVVVSTEEGSLVESDVYTADGFVCMEKSQNPRNLVLKTKAEEQIKEFDYSRPLKMKNGTKITRVTEKENGNFKAFFTSEDGSEDYFNYDKKGMFITEEDNKNFEKHLIYDEEVAQPERLLVKRRVVDFRIHPHTEDCKGFVIAKSDDARLFALTIGTFTEMKWHPLPELPQD